MKKMIIRLPAKYFDSCARFKGIAEYYEIVAFFNYSKTCYTEVCKVVLHEGRSIDEVPRDNVEDLTVLKSDGKEYTVLMKGRVTCELSEIIDNCDLKLEDPVTFDESTCRLSIVGAPEDLRDVVKKSNETDKNLEVLAVHEYDPEISGILDLMTGKQRSIFKQAYDSGYFDYPRKINAGQLSDKLGISKTTLLEHLHKAENKIITHIIEQSDK